MLCLINCRCNTKCRATQSDGNLDLCTSDGAQGGHTVTREDNMKNVWQKERILCEQLMAIIRKYKLLMAVVHRYRMYTADRWKIQCKMNSRGRTTEYRQRVLFERRNIGILSNQRLYSVAVPRSNFEATHTHTHT
jgi:hypothetical protein